MESNEGMEQIYPYRAWNRFTLNKDMIAIGHFASWKQAEKLLQQEPYELALNHHPTKMNWMQDFVSLCSPYPSFLQQAAIFNQFSNTKSIKQCSKRIKKSRSIFTCLVGNTMSTVFIIPIHSTNSIDLPHAQFLFKFNIWRYKLMQLVKLNST